MAKESEGEKEMKDLFVFDKALLDCCSRPQSKKSGYLPYILARFTSVKRRCGVKSPR